MWLVATRGEVKYCNWLRDVMSCHMTSREVTSSSCEVMSRQVMYCGVMSCHLTCDVMGTQCKYEASWQKTWSFNNAQMIRPWSDHQVVIPHPPDRRPYFFDRSGYLPKFYHMLLLHLPLKMTLQHHQILHLPSLQHHGKYHPFLTLLLLHCSFCFPVLLFNYCFVAQFLYQTIST